MTKRILVIDDDPTSNTLVSFLMKTNGYEVSVATNGKEGLEAADQNKPDLIVLDVMMPEMDGYTFLRELKQKNRLNIPPVLMLTSKDQMEETFRIEGVAGYFSKPLDVKNFLALVKKLVPPQDL